MAKPDKIHMPSGMGGLTRYFDDVEAKVQLKPHHIVVLSIAAILIIITLHIFGPRLLGLT